MSAIVIGSLAVRSASSGRDVERSEEMSGSRTISERRWESAGQALAKLG
jgi:hypothetical protein